MTRFSRHLSFAASLAGCLLVVAGRPVSTAPCTPPASRAGSLTPHAAAPLPVVFVPNVGQFPPEVRFVARDRGATVLFTDRETVFVPDTAATGGATPVRLRFGDARARRYRAAARQAWVVNDYRGADPSRWRTSVPVYAELHLDDVGPGIGVVFRHTGEHLEYDLRIAPGADPRNARLLVQGADRLEPRPDGSLAMIAGDWTLVSRAPRTFQERGGERRELAADYVVEGRHRFGFDVASLDPTLTTVIDPEVTYSAVVGGDRGDHATAVATDASGAVYVAGYTSSLAFTGLATTRPEPVNWLHYGAFVAKVGASGLPQWVTFLGGRHAWTWHGTTLGDRPRSLAIDGGGQAVVVGETSSSDFPTLNALQASVPCQRVTPLSPGCSNGFAVRLTPSGEIAYSTYLGGADGSTVAADVAVTPTGEAWIGGTTRATQFETTHDVAGAPRGALFLLKLSASGQRVSAIRLGDDSTAIEGVALDPLGQPALVGTARAGALPMRHALLEDCAPATCAFIVKLEANARDIVHSTFFAGTGPSLGSDVAVDAEGRTVVVGITSAAGLPLLHPEQPEFGGGQDAFVAVFTPAGALAYASYLGGEGPETSADDRRLRVAVDPTGAVLVAGTTGSLRFPLNRPIGAAHPDGPVFRSDDGGDSWGVANLGLSGNVNALASDPARPETLYAATDAGLFRTEDGGATWNRLRLTEPDRGYGSSVTGIVVESRDASVLFGVTHAGVFRSGDRGHSWEAIGPSLPGGRTLQLVAVSPRDGTIVLGGPGVFVSTDGGRNWADRSQFLRIGPTGVRSGPEVVVADPWRAGTVWAGTTEGLYRSQDHGETWAEVVGGEYGTEFVRALAIDPRTPGHVIAGTFNRGVLRSQDEGRTWQRVDEYAAVKAVAFDAVLAGVVYAIAAGYGESGAVLRSTDGGATWERKDSGLRSRYLTSLAPVTRRGASVLVGGSVADAGFLVRLERAVPSLTDPRIGASGGLAGAIGVAADGPVRYRLSYSTYLEPGDPRGLAVAPNGRVFLALFPRPGSGAPDEDILVLGLDEGAAERP